MSAVLVAKNSIGERNEARRLVRRIAKSTAGAVMIVRIDVTNARGISHAIEDAR
jgi:hypothetical protein